MTGGASLHLVARRAVLLLPLLLGLAGCGKVNEIPQLDEAVKAFGTVHILVNNAALYYDIDNFDPSFEYLQRVTGVNQHGAWLMTRARVWEY